jgi:hypothetical protein
VAEPKSRAKKIKTVSTKKLNAKEAGIRGSKFKHGTLDRSMEEAAGKKGFKYVVGTDEGLTPLFSTAYRDSQSYFSPASFCTRRSSHLCAFARLFAAGLI